MESTEKTLMIIDGLRLILQPEEVKLLKKYDKFHKRIVSANLDDGEKLVNSLGLIGTHHLVLEIKGKFFLSPLGELVVKELKEKKILFKEEVKVEGN